MTKSLKQLREKAGLSVKDLAAKLDTELSTVYRWESGHTKPQFEQLLKLQEILGEEVMTLLSKRLKRKAG